MEEPRQLTVLVDLQDAVWSLSPPELAEEEARLRACRQVPNNTVLDAWSDEDLALAVKKGFLECEMFEELMYRRYENQVGCWLFRLTHNREKARDLTQEVHLKLWRSRLEHYDPAKGLFRPWLSTLVYHLGLSDIRREGHLTFVSGADREHPDSHADPTDEAVAHETAERVQAILPRLPDLERQILEATMCGQEASTIAATLGLSKTRVFQLLYRARRAVERVLLQQNRPAAGRVS